LARTFDIGDREDLRVNGGIGLDGEVDPDWSLRIVGIDGEPIETLGLADVQALDHHDLVWEHKCIEGWANVVHWTGARFADLVARYRGDAVPADFRYVSLRTPDEEYYVGLDREVAMHPQALLAWALNGEPLSEGHGAPLRLAMPITYGIKQLKRIGTIEFTNTRPPDYWAERGYDWHARF
jgi:DMSO/TMAO reductase YedYZ molybdopterin-dependent catalytic subunit